ncbi:MAG: hypothetical protein HOV81_12785 [Kofleriaceae bacterium]|nr:hypothetical protein [Kofleriaceae bacterium]
MDLRRGVLLGVLVTAACSDGPPGRTYYERNIETIFIKSCKGNTSGCHATNVGDAYAFAAGNFDVTTFENVQKRRDLLAPFGPYQQPLLLIKAVAPELPNPMDPNKLFVQYGKTGGGTDQFLPIDVVHGGGSVLDVSSDDYFTLQTWMENGATENGLKPPTPARSGSGSCSTSVPSNFNPAMYTSNATYNTFKNDVAPILKDKGCNASNCHGAPQSDFYITCGDDDTQMAFNFSQAWSFVNDPVDDSQLLRVPLAVAAGGRGHTGGDQFSSDSDDDYVKVRAWAEAVKKLAFADTPEKTFFEQNVQPVLLQRGCSFQGCHSPAATNDFKLRSGTQGFFSAIALERNYELLRNEFMAIEFPDARRGRAVAKTILEDDYRLADQVGGMHGHRGGSVLETPGSANGSDPALCPTWTGNTAPANVTAFCVIQEWINRERAALGTQVTQMNSGDTMPVVFVDRPAGQAADRLEFDTFQGGADLVVSTATFGANFGHDMTLGAPTTLLGDASCAGARGGDIQAPDVANDGDTVAFAARPSANVPLSVWTVKISTGVCTQITPASGMIHNFDPAFSPDGQWIVFASTRGKSGPTLSRKRMLPQSDLWRIKLPSGTPEQVTWLSNSEISPQFMREGRMTMTTEKASDGFYQLAGRRLNWDLTDYHPLLAQRNTSAYKSLTDLAESAPSIGYSAATDIREGSDGNFLLIVSDLGTDGKPVVPGGGGALGIFNRSVGPFEQDRTDKGYLPSFKLVDAAAATGRSGATAAYRSPVTMPDGQIMASYAPTAGALAWRLVAVNPRTNAQTTLLAPAGGRAYVDAVLAIKYPARQLYLNRRQLVFGGGTDTDADHAVLYIPDAPMTFTLLTGNLRRGRPVDAFRKATKLVVETEGMCPPGSCTRGSNGIYENRMMLGAADLDDDGSVKVRLPSKTGVVLSLANDDGTVIKMGEEHQLGPGEEIAMGVRQTIKNFAGQTVNLYDAVCGGCHGTVTGRELDVFVTPDALTGASASASQTKEPKAIGP